MRVAAALVLIAAPALADGPPPEFFTGQYRMIGLGGTGPVDLRLRLDPDDGELGARDCAGGQGRLVFEDGFERVYLAGDLAGMAVNCQVFTDHDNYPLLACYGGEGERLTLWPDHVGVGDVTLDCGN